MSLIQGNVDEDGNATILAEIRNRFSNAERLIVQADIATITYSVFDGSGAVVSGHNEANLNVATAILDAPRNGDADEAWTIGGAGYNFVHDLAASAFPMGNQTYTYEAKLTYTDGRIGWVRAQLVAANILTS